ncbi:MAG: SRPBCC family protein [Polyangia bacterium]
MRRAALIVILPALLLGSLAGVARAEPHPAPLARLPASSLIKLAPILRTSDVALIESNDKGAMKQLTTVTLAAAAPELVRDVVIHPERYGQFVRNMKQSTVKRLPDGSMLHQYNISYTIYSVDGRHRYVLLPHDGPGAAPVEMYDPDANGVRHYRWEFLPAGQGTVIVLYGYTLVPRDGFITRFLKQAPTLEYGLALIPQMTLLLSMKRRAEQLGGGKALPAAGGSAADYEFLLDRGTVALFRSVAGRISDISLIDRSAARPDVLMQVARDPTQWSQFIPTLKRSTPLGAKNGISGVELERKLPLCDWTTTYAYRSSASSVDLFGIGGDLHGARLRWDVRPSGAASQLVLRAIMHFDQGSMVVRELYKLEPYFEYGVDVGLELLMIQGVRARAEQLSRSSANR